MQLADAPDVFAYASDPSVAAFVEWAPHQSVSESEEFIERVLSPWWAGITFAIELRDVERVVGTCELRIVSRVEATGEIGYVLARSVWGQGYNVEAGAALLFYAFRIEGLRRVEARCKERNRRSYRTLEKLGLRQDRGAMLHGRPGYLHYSLLVSEWDRHPLHRKWRETIVTEPLGRRPEG